MADVCARRESTSVTASRLTPRKCANSSCVNSKQVAPDANCKPKSQRARPGPVRMVALQGGHALRIDRDEMRRRFFEAQAIQESIFQYTYSQIRLMAQTVTCNCRHRLEQRMCRWILSVQDRSPSRVIKITHEMMSHFLGVRREAITNAAGRLQRDGMVEYSRGYLTVLNRDLLENEACECYQEGLDVLNLRKRNRQYGYRGCEQSTPETACWNRSASSTKDL